MKTTTYQSPSSFPRFEPHITLATVPSSTSVDDLRTAIPIDQSPVPAIFKSVEVGDKYFMSVYVTVHHSGELNALRETLKNNLGERAVPPIAHISLFYIDNSEPEERAKVADQLRNHGRIVEQGEDRIALDCAERISVDSPARELIDNFDGCEIWIALCDGPVDTWEVKERIRLHKA
jgi:2',3'-cyclic-nucleotide 3'-phosphodiesterase